MNDAEAALQGLHDIVLPAPVSWMPQTPASWILLGILLLALIQLTVMVVRRRRTNRYRWLALARLARIETALVEPSSRADAVTALAVLVKQTALAFRPRSEVGALSGAPWLRFLDESYGGTGFTEGPGRLLAVLAYSTPVTQNRLPAAELEALVGLVRLWIRRHRVRV